MSLWDSSILAQTMVLTSNVCFWLGTVLVATWLQQFLIILQWSLRSTVGGIFLKLRYAVKLPWTTESFQIFNKISGYWLLCCCSVSYENYVLQLLVHVCTVCFKTEYLITYVWKEFTNREISETWNSHVPGVGTHRKNWLEICGPLHKIFFLFMMWPLNQYPISDLPCNSFPSSDQY